MPKNTVWQRGLNMYDIDILRTYSLEQVNNMYKNGGISESLTLAYIKLWNDTANRYSTAELRDGMIRTTDKYDEMDQ